MTRTPAPAPVSLGYPSLGLLFAALAVIGGAVYRMRLKRVREVEDTALSDDMIRQIEARGSIDFDDPLDYDEIQREEARFWEEERWEEADEW